jgi:NAD(P)-dependent dehydrogenase (short-subunit alcohol dehydrogenase family)
VFDLSRRTALVTGAGQNIGTGIARTLAARGATVYVNDVLVDRAEAVAESIRVDGGHAVAAPFDVTDSGAVGTAVAGIGPVDVLVNNAGNGGDRSMVLKPFLDLTPDDWRAAIDVNLYGVLNCCHAVLAGMVERGWGRVITISSLAGTMGTRLGVTPYSAGKGGALAFMRSLALENARSGITATSIALGLMDTGSGETTGEIARSIPVGRRGTPADVAALCAYLAADESSWITAQTIHLDGGVSPT